MAHSQVRFIAKLNDRDVIRAFESVREQFSDRPLALRFNDAFGEVSGDELEKISGLAGYSLTSAVLSSPPISWSWSRLSDPNDPHSATFDRFTFSWDNRAGAPDRLATSEISATLARLLNRPLASVDPNVQPLASHSEILVALESATAKILHDATEHRQILEREHLQRAKELDDRVAADRDRELARIGEERTRIETDLANRSTGLDERSQELDDLQKKLDDRNNTHVRRQIRSSLLELAKERLANFAVSKETRAQYFAVHIAAITGLTLLALGSVTYGSRVVPDPTTGAFPAAAIALAVKSAAMAAAALALGSWYLGWLNRWLQRIADAEFKLQQFRLDIERASWLAETVLEWKSVSTEPFPDLLATRLSTGLFSSARTEHDDPKTPAAQLAEALFGAAASAKLKLGDQEVALDRRSIRGLTRQPQTE